MLRQSVKQACVRAHRSKAKKSAVRSYSSPLTHQQVVRDQAIYERNSPEKGKIKSYPIRWTEPTPVDSAEVYAEKVQKYQDSPDLLEHYKQQQAFYQDFRASRLSTHVVDDWEYAPMMQTFHQIVDQQISEYEHKSILRQVHEDVLVTWKDMKAKVIAFAAGLRETCGEPGTSLTMAMPNKVEGWVSILGACRSQKHPAAMLPPHIFGKPLVDAMERFRPGLFLFAPKVANKVQLENIYETFPYLNSTPYFEESKHEVLTELKYVLHTGKRAIDGMVPLPCIQVHDPMPTIADWKKLDRESDPRIPNMFVYPHPMEKVQEAVHWNEYAIVNSAIFVGNKIGLTEDDSVVTNIPPYRTAGLIYGWGLTMAFRSRFVIPWEVFSPEHTLRTIEMDKGTVLVDTPSNLRQLLSCELLAGTNTSSLRAAIIVGYPGEVPDSQLVKDVLEKLDLDRVVVTMGSQNVSVIFAETHENYLGHGGKFGPSSSLPFNRVALMQENGDIVEMGQQGNIGVQGWGSTRSVAALECQPLPGFAYTPFKAVMDKDKRFTVLEDNVA